MLFAIKRKIAPDMDEMPDTKTEKTATVSEETTAGPKAATEESPSEGGGSALVDKANERRERFKALQARAVNSNVTPMKDLYILTHYVETRRGAQHERTSR